MANFARVCSYEHSGNGWSESGPKPRTSPRIVGELHTLLKHAGLNGLYVLVGHSFGGANAQLYAAEYPKEVVGIVLIDSALDLRALDKNLQDPSPKQRLGSSLPQSCLVLDYQAENSLVLRLDASSQHYMDGAVLDRNAPTSIRRACEAGYFEVAVRGTPLRVRTSLYLGQPGKGRCVRAVPFLVLEVVAVLLGLAVVGVLYLLVCRWL